MTNYKLKKIQKMLREYKMDAIILRMSVNILALTGYWTCNHAVAAVIPSRGTAAIILPTTELEVAEKEACQLEICSYELESTEKLKNAMMSMENALKRVFDEKGLNKARIGVEKSFEDGASSRMFGDFKYPAMPTWKLLKTYFSHAKFCDATELISKLRMTKEPEEILAISKAVKIACIGYDEVRKQIKEGMSEAEVAAILESAIMINGTGKNDAKYTRGFASVYSGARGAKQWSHWACSSGKIIEKNDIVIMELGVVCDGYWADLTRCICIGKASEEEKQVIEILIEAQTCGFNVAKEGASIGDIDRACHEYCEKMGYGSMYYKHNCGHATGYNYHEAPPVHQACDTPLQEGMVLCVEPGIYIEDKFGMRVEDMIVITKDRPMILSKYTHDL